jgi:iron complex outermembrane recepter protein
MTAGLALLAAVPGRSIAADLDSHHAFAIPSQSVSSALLVFSEQAKIQVMTASADLAGITSLGVSGDHTAREALDALLKGTGLKFRSVSADAVAIEPAKGGRTAPPPATSTSSDASDGLRTAQVDQDAAGPQKITLDEIVVTAQKRNERLQDVPVPVTVLSGSSLIENNEVRLKDYYSSVPGLNVTPADFGAPQITIRGLTTGGNTNPSVGIVIDDVPYGSSTILGGGFLAPDFDPSDLASVEVLRGPQGTLYGANSLGGLLKYVTVDPSTDALSGRFEGGTSTVQNGAELGYNFRGAVNVPLSDTVAVRASAFARRDPGYIDNVLVKEDGVNRTYVSGGRLSGIWKPSDQFSMKLSALLQNSRASGSSYVDQSPGMGDLQQSTVPHSGFFDSKIQAYSINMTGKLGVAEITSLTGYNVNTLNNALDFTPLAGVLSNALFQVGGAPELNYNKTKKFTQEVRLRTPIGERLEWLVGAFYTHEDDQSIQQIVAVDLTTGSKVGSLLNVNFPTTYAEYAGFTDLTVHMTEQFSVQLGARESQNRQSYSTTWVGPYVPIVLQVPSPLIPPRSDTKANAFTYLVTPEYRLSPDLMVYARLASGYRPGGPNVNSTLNTLPTFAPDKTENYEIGMKGDALEHMLTFDASLYYITWRDIQLQLIDPVAHVAVYTNAGRAKSQGLELSVQAKPLRGLRLASWVSFNDAVLTQAFPAASPADGADGDRLPDGSRFSGNFSVDEDFPLTGALTGYVGAAVSYIGAREGVFTLRAAPQRQTLPGYAKTDLHAGLRFNSWTANLYASNLTNRRGVLNGGLGTALPMDFYYIQPRTIGLLLSWTF